MIFQNPWGLLALGAVPLIMALHFFRNRRQMRRIGGLHLWLDAAVRMPMGRRWDRLLKSFSLLFQLLAAVLLALLLGGLDKPDSSALRHYVVVLDDSASMTAADAKPEDAPVEQARKLIQDWAPERARFTVIAAGAAPRVLAGPFAARDEMLSALKDWQPQAPACDLQAALALGGKFAQTGSDPADVGDNKAADGKQAKQPQKLLFVTDDAQAAKGYGSLVEVAALGRPLANAGFLFADRLRVSAARDRVVLTVKNYNGASAQTTLRATVLGQEIYKGALALPPDGSVQQAFETASVAEDIHVEIAPDTFAADNAIALAPVAVKFVHLARVGLDAADQPLSLAVRAVPYATQSTPDKADLLLMDRLPDAEGVGKDAKIICYFNDRPTTDPVRIAAGTDLHAEAGAHVFDGIGFEGVLWPYWPRALEGRAGVVLTAGQVQGSEGLAQRYAPLEGAQMYTFNLRLAASNLFKQPAWPLLVRNLIEETRQLLPGLSRSNYNAGETLQLKLSITTGSCELRRVKSSAGGDAAPGAAESVAKFDNPPRVLAGLAPGVYDLAQGAQVLAHFAVNLIAPGESDLRAVQPAKAELSAVAGGQARAATINPAIFYALLLGAIASIIGAWACQDRSR